MIDAKTESRRSRDADFARIYAEAVVLGLEASAMACPTTMVVEQHANMLDDRSPVVRAYQAPEGACGFAWVRVAPATGSFARWLTKNRHARRGYYGGVELSIAGFSQSLERNEANARAMAAHIRQYATDLGFESCSVQSRID
jgi:hypothetical protein